MPKDVKPHQLTKQVGRATTRWVFEGSVYDNAASTTSADWENIPVQFGTGIVPGIINRTYIDLAGWSRQELTAFFNGFDIQRSLPPLSITGVALIFEYDFITSRKLTRGELSNIFNEPGFLSSTLDLSQLIYGEKRVWGQNVNIPGSFIIVDAETSGTGDATAMDKLHWTRLIVYGAAATAADIEASATNLVVSAVTAKEKDLVWMERLRRSYVLEDRTDV
ncbi:MAG TPA: hypothetical protein EYO33_02640 [Phycisphaerales bacterium]|nr:hypothetical protein [Phycisphaerales bacterium]